MKKAFFILGACLLAMAIIGAGFLTRQFYIDDSHLSLELSGLREIYLEYGESYLEPGAQAQFYKDKTVTEIPVTITGEVNASQVGKYRVEYVARERHHSRTDCRTVYVVDTQKPVITLVTDPDAYTIPGQPYTEEGFSAWDNYDGDLTDKVTSHEENGFVTYTVSDSSGNTFSIQREIYYFNPSRPEIRLTGDSVTLILMGDTYTDPGATATDPNDGDLTAAITVDGAIDTTVTGIQTVRYTVTNSFGLSTTAERTVYVLDPALVPEPENAEEDPEAGLIPEGGMAYNPTGKVIYLTFDDGPSKYTEKLLDILAKYNVKVSFFVVGSSHADSIARAAREGHTVAIHTYSHNYSKIYASDEAYMADLQAIQSIITQQTGITTKLMRFPGGSSNTISSLYNRGIMTRLVKNLTEQGYTYFDWNVDSNDAGGARTPEAVFENIVKGVSQYNNSVVLQHDSHEYSVDAVERVIVWALCNGYTFQPLTENSPTAQHGVNN